MVAYKKEENKAAGNNGSCGSSGKNNGPQEEKGHGANKKPPPLGTSTTVNEEATPRSHGQNNVEDCCITNEGGINYDHANVARVVVDDDDDDDDALHDLAPLSIDQAFFPGVSINDSAFHHHPPSQSHSYPSHLQAPSNMDYEPWPYNQNNGMTNVAAAGNNQNSMLLQGVPRQQQPHPYDDRKRMAELAQNLDKDFKAALFEPFDERIHTEHSFSLSSLATSLSTTNTDLSAYLYFFIICND